MSVHERHEAAVLRFFMERVRSPELACDLTAETFATALVVPFDPSRQTEADWVLGLANAQLLRAYRVGTVDDAARRRLRMPPLALDDRTLDRVWQLRGEDRHEARKPHLSAGVVVGEAGRGVVAAGEGVRGRGVGGRPCTSSVDLVAQGARNSTLALPGLAGALDAVAARRRGGRTRRRRLVIAARVALALVTVTWVVGEAVIPDRPAAASGSWLPYEAEHARGEFPRLWYMAPPSSRAVVTFTTFATGAGPRCAAMGAGDALVSITARRPADPRCPGEISRRPLRDGLWALVVLGPQAPKAVRDEADAIVERVRRPA